MKLAFATLICTVALSVVSSVGTASADTTPSSTPPTNCHGSFDPYDYTRDALAACGIPTFPASITALPGGGQLYSYHRPDGGLFAETPLPPTGFDPTTATPAQLTQYGYPQRPSDLSAEAVGSAS